MFQAGNCGAEGCIPFQHLWVCYSHRWKQDVVQTPNNTMGTWAFLFACHPLLSSTLSSPYFPGGAQAYTSALLPARLNSRLLEDPWHIIFYIPTCVFEETGYLARSLNHLLSRWWKGTFSTWNCQLKIKSTKACSEFRKAGYMQDAYPKGQLYTLFDLNEESLCSMRPLSSWSNFLVRNRAQRNGILPVWQMMMWIRTLLENSS